MFFNKKPSLNKNYLIVMKTSVFVLLLIGAICTSLFFFFRGCKAYPDEKFVFDPYLRSVINAIASKDTFAFRDSAGDRKVFVVTKIDSVKYNRKGGFMNPVPSKELTIQFSEIVKDTISSVWNNNAGVYMQPADNYSFIYFSFNGFIFSDTALPSLSYAPLILNNNAFTNYHVFRTSAKSTKENEIDILYVDTAIGFLGFRTGAGKVWVRETDKANTYQEPDKMQVIDNPGKFDTILNLLKEHNVDEFISYCSLPFNMDGTGITDPNVLRKMIEDRIEHGDIDEFLKGKRMNYYDKNEVLFEVRSFNEDGELESESTLGFTFRQEADGSCKLYSIMLAG
jgi:hypothetical protein